MKAIANFEASLAVGAILAFGGDIASAIAPISPLVQDAPSAIRIARAMVLAMHPDPRNYSEEEWERHCGATLSRGVWHIYEKKHVSGQGYFTGAAVISIGAQDGRFLGELFAD